METSLEDLENELDSVGQCQTFDFLKERVKFLKRHPHVKPCTGSKMRVLEQRWFEISSEVVGQKRL